MYMPVLTYSEENAVMNHQKELCALGTKALIVSGKHSSYENGSMDDIKTALEQGNCSYVIFDKVEENPSIETVVSGAAFGREQGADFVIGVGGGSPLDAAKAIAYLMKQKTITSEMLYQTGNDDRLPLALIPTTCGTGSEVTPVSVLTIRERQTKKSIAHKIFADLALIDGKYLSTASLSVLRNTSLDALTHLIESYLNTKADDLSRMFVDSGLALWRQNRSILEKGDTDASVRQSMMNASAMAGMAIAQTSTTIPHGLSYSLTIKRNIPHGKAVGYFTAGYLNEAPAKDREYLLSRMGFESVEAFEEWYLRLYGKAAAEESILEAAAEELWQNKAKLSSVPFEADRECLKRIAFYTFRF